MFMELATLVYFFPYSMYAVTHMQRMKRDIVGVFSSRLTLTSLEV